MQQVLQLLKYAELRSMAPQELKETDLHQLITILRDLFNKYDNTDPASTTLRSSAARQQKRPSTVDWVASAISNTSPEGAEIRTIVTRQLVVIQTNLGFAAMNGTYSPNRPDVLRSLKDTERWNWIQQLEGTTSEALEAIDSAIDRLNKVKGALRDTTINERTDWKQAHINSDASSTRIPIRETTQSFKRKIDYAKSQLDKGNYKEAEEQYRVILKLSSESTGIGEPCIVSIKCNLANALAKQGQRDEPEILYREALKLSTGCLEETHPNILACRINLARMLEMREKYDEAKGIYRDVLRLQEEAAGPSSLSTLSAKNRLANVLVRLKIFEAAEDIYKETLKAHGDNGREEHPSAIITLGNLANALQNQGQYEEAKTRYLEAKDLCKKTFNSKHPYLDWVTTRLEELEGVGK
ncbi:unnamed protein product [Fusarium graminearum]|uniref:Kinesin light chain n=1 Tax=Gibberella zeae TaxID=5518 RepID=A0A9N8RCE7_GIBZA|nr:unnamed protein product [Fusarium graminearum]CAG2013399.1 unnamed protein product [Fusarium graminearum]